MQAGQTNSLARFALVPLTFKVAPIKPTLPDERRRGTSDELHDALARLPEDSNAGLQLRTTNRLIASETSRLLFAK